MKHQQLVYLDESGDAGFKVLSGSSPVLLVAATIFDSASDAEATAERICAFRESIGKNQRFQFHFASLRRDWREGFLRAVSDCPFRIRSIVMHKDQVRDDALLRRSSRYFYNFTLKMLLTHTLGSVTEAKVFVDGEGSRALRRDLAAYLRRECNSAAAKVIDELKFAPKSNVLIQLADMVASGLVRSYRPGKTDARVYREILLPRIENVWEFGRD